ncbi:MAG TPA: hypothetical protein VI893_06555 [Thermoplasmata archaeon]|nr:hypothetical protein [Thermoplasmata archaeon]
MVTLLEKCTALLEHAPPEDVDDHARRQLATKVFDWENRKKGELAMVAFRADGQPSGTLYDLFEARPRPDTMDLMFYNFIKSESWDYNLPTSRLTILPKGFGFIYHFEYHQFKTDDEKWDESKFIQTKCMIRAWISSFFVPENIKTKLREDAPKRLWTPPVVSPQELWEGALQRGVVPLVVRMLVYTKKRRHAFEINLLRNTLLKDFRAGTFPAAGFAPRDMEVYPEFDKWHSSLDIPEIPRRIMEMAFEAGRITPRDVMHVFGTTHQAAVSNIDVLVNRGILSVQEGSGQRQPDSRYIFSMDWMRRGGKVEVKEMRAAPVTAASTAKTVMDEGRESRIAMRPDAAPVARGGALDESGRKACGGCGTMMGAGASACPGCGKRV